MIVGMIILIKKKILLTFCGSLTRKLLSFLLKINEMNIIINNQIKVKLLFFMSILLKYVAE